MAIDIVQQYQVGPDDPGFSDEELEGFKWVVNWYTSGSHDGSGEASGLYSDGLVYSKNLSHCSCYGPTDGGMRYESSETVTQFLADRDDIHQRDACALVKSKARELLAPEFTSDDPEYLALMETASDHPEDDAPQLILADWLEEHDQDQRAKAIHERIAWHRQLENQ